MAAGKFGGSTRQGGICRGNRKAMAGGRMTTATNIVRSAQLDTSTGRDIQLDVQRIRADFPILKRQIHGKPLVYLDNAATTQKPQTVIDALVSYYTNENANIHRGVHTLSAEATESHDEA